ncbi:MAG: hypothetical protein ACTHMU_03690 [Thermomicrobiales bacterium]
MNDAAETAMLRFVSPVMIPLEMKRAVRDAVEERTRQEIKWGEQNHAPIYWLGILTEELGEIAKEAIEAREYTGRENAGNGDRYRAELVQLAAVALAAIESYDRNEARDGR